MCISHISLALNGLISTDVLLFVNLNFIRFKYQIVRYYKYNKDMI